MSTPFDWKYIKHDGYPPDGHEVEVASDAWGKSHRIRKMIWKDGIWWRRKGKFLMGIFDAAGPEKWRFLPTKKGRKKAAT